MIQLNDIGKMADELAKVKLLALDLDGTILTDEKHVTERMAAALLAAVDAGLITVYVTGRPLTGIPDDLSMPRSFSLSPIASISSFKIHNLADRSSSARPLSACKDPTSTSVVAVSTVCTFQRL